MAVDVLSGASWPSAGSIQVRVDRLDGGGATDIEAGSINVSTDWVGNTFAVVLLDQGGERAGRSHLRI